MARVSRRFDFSGGIQSATTWILGKANEVEDAVNARFNKHIGSVIRRLGYSSTVNSVAFAAIQTGKSGLGLHEAKFSTGATIFGASNNSGDTATVVKTLNTSTGAWTSLSGQPSLAASTRVRMIDSLGEMYVCGQVGTTGTRVTPYNVKNDLTVSTSRNLVGAPDCAFMVEYGGALYAINCKVGSTVYADRAYRSSPALGVITFVQGVQVPTSTSSFVVKVDSVRYLKTNLAVDIYQAGKSTQIMSNITPSAVDKNLNTITITPIYHTFATTDVNTGTDVLTVATNIPTGTPISFSSSGSVPTGLVSGTVYYAINQSSTTLKVATTYANAIAGTAIDISATGSGTHTIYQGVNDNDEIWGYGRKGELAYYWNTDYPTTEDADFLRIPPGVSSDSSILGYAKTNNRLMLFTATSTYKWDNANLVTVYEDIGCPSFETIANLRGWVLWMTADGQVYARNDSTGQDEVISEALRNDFLDALTTTNITGAAAGVSNWVYKLCVGTATIAGESTIHRFCYDFKANNWARETHGRAMKRHMRSDFSGSMKLYFMDDTAGKLYQDEVGNTDDGTTIPMRVKFGRENFGTEQDKAMQGWYIYGTSVAGATVKATMTDQDPVEVGQLAGSISRLVAPKELDNGRDVNMEITHHADTDPPEIEGIVTYYDLQEDNFG